MRHLVAVLLCCTGCESVTRFEVPVVTVDVEVTGRCTGTPCDEALLDRYPLIMPSSGFEAAIYTDLEGTPIITLCGVHAKELARYRVTRVNRDGGTEEASGWGGGYGTGTTWDVNTQYHLLGDGADFNTLASLYALSVTGPDFEGTPGHPHDLAPVWSDGGVFVFEYAPFRYVDPDGGFRPSVREELPFTFTETHRITSQRQTIEEHYSECPPTLPEPQRPGWY